MPFVIDMLRKSVWLMYELWYMVTGSCLHAKQQQVRSCSGVCM